MYKINQIAISWNKIPMKLGINEEKEIEIDEKLKWNDIETDENESFGYWESLNWIEKGKILEKYK
jgi:hypothetical protein